MIAFLSNYLFEKTSLPDMMFLIILGIIIGPITGLISTTSIIGLAPYLAALALVFILFDGGMALNIYRVFAESPRATILALVGFTLNVILTTLFMMYVVMLNTLVLLFFGN